MCIDMSGSCINAMHASCGGELRRGYNCPENSLCCLPYGSLCAHLGGECTGSTQCRDGKLVDQDIECSESGDTVCCLDRTARHVGVDPRADVEQSRHASEDTKGNHAWKVEGGMLALHVGNGTATIPSLSTETILNSIFIPVVYTVTVGVALSSVTIWRASTYYKKSSKALA